MSGHELGLFVFRWAHVLFGIAWIGMLYYFNFVQGEYFKEATADAKSDAVQKLVPRALWYFRWGAMFTFVTGLVLLLGMVKTGTINDLTMTGAILGILMFLNVWLIIWPNQQVIIGLKEGDKAAAGAKALLASRTNVLFSAPMLFGMLSGHLSVSSYPDHLLRNAEGMHISMSYAIVLVIIAALEANALFGKVGPMASVKGVIHFSLALVALLYGLLLAL
jgi:uncharacterized membrane protein